MYKGILFFTTRLTSLKGCCCVDQDIQFWQFLFFFLFMQKPSLLQLVFNVYGRAPKTVKQVFSIVWVYHLQKPKRHNFCFHRCMRSFDKKVSKRIEVMQAVHRHIPNLVRNLGSSFSEFLRIISDPPQGSENLLMLVFSIYSIKYCLALGSILTIHNW